jgi:uncharacterized protein
VRYYKLAADQGHARPQFDLGICYSNGTGAAKDEVEAKRYYKLAAYQGHIAARRKFWASELLELEPKR